jgi:hypothetical protein
MKALQLFSHDLRPFTVEPDCHIINGVTYFANRPNKFTFNLSGHPLSDDICEFLITRGPLWPSGTLFSYCIAFKRLIEHLSSSGYSTLNAESFASFTVWLKKVNVRLTTDPLGESTRRGYGNFVLRFMEWLADLGRLSARNAFKARLRHQKAFQGSNARRLVAMRLKAISPEELLHLLRSIRLEYEACGRLMNAPQFEQDNYDHTFPLLPFSMLLGAELAVRSVEFNYLRVRDLRDDQLFLNPPNKRASRITLSASVMAAFELARKWMLRYRTGSSPDDPLLVCPLREGPRSDLIVRFDTPLLNSSLKRFYRKYFDLIAPDGMPYLYSIVENDELVIRPFSLSFRDFRSAALTEAARHERNPTVVMRFARHQSFTPTLKFYIRETHKQWVTNVARFLAPSAELVRLSLDNRVASDIEERTAKLADANVPGGHCQQALMGDRSCRRASDCRLCAFFRIHVSKREFFVREREDALKQARELQNQHGLLRDAQNLREFASLNQAIISRIDEYLMRG